MRDPLPFVDIHCHLVPGVDDGAKDWAETLAMAQMAVEDGFETIIVTPHQLGHFSNNRGPDLRGMTTQLQTFLDDQNVPLRVMPGGDVRIEPDMVRRIVEGEVMSLGDLRRHVLLELPHDVYVPLDRLLGELRSAGMVGVLSHPERNLAILADLRLAEQVVAAGGLLQVTAGSFTGSFGPEAQTAAERLLDQGLIHFVATDAHGIRSRRPRMRPAFQRIAERAGWQTAVELCCRNPSLVAQGQDVPAGRRRGSNQSQSVWSRWFGKRRAG